MSTQAEGQGVATEEQPGNDPIQSAIATLNAAGYKTFQEAEFTSLLDQTKQSHEREVISPRISKIYQDLDTDIRTASGVEKNQGEKTYDYAKRVLGTLQSQIEALKSATPGAEALKSEYETKLQQETTRFNTAIAAVRFDQAIATLDVAAPANLSDEDAKAYKAQQVELIRAAASTMPYRIDQDGKLIFQVKTADGSLIDAVDPRSGEALDPAKVLSEKFKALLVKPEPAQGGTGTKPAQAQGQRIPQTKQELNIMLQEQGLEMGSKAFNDAYAKGVTDYGLTKSTE